MTTWNITQRTGTASTVDRHQVGTNRNMYDGPIITISPDRLFFGVVSSGFYYTLKFTIQNNSLSPIRIRATLHPRDDEKNLLRIINLPDRIAPGMLISITVELTAQVNSISMFDLRIVQNLDASVCTHLIEAHVVSPETFKYVRKSLELQKRPIYRQNVNMVTAIAGMDTSSLATASTTFSEALIMDDEDINDLLMFPMAPNVYWDPFDKKLRIDPRLGGVIVDERFEDGVEDSERKTNRMRNDRLMDLEEQGFLTQPAMERLRYDHDNPPPPKTTESVASNNHNDDASHDGFESKAGESFHDDAAMSHASSRVSSVASLLALKRGKLESMRRATINAANEFAQNSKKDSMVNSMRTLTMIQSRVPGMGKTMSHSD